MQRSVDYGTTDDVSVQKTKGKMCYDQDQISITLRNLKH